MSFKHGQSGDTGADGTRFVTPEHHTDLLELQRRTDRKIIIEELHTIDVAMARQHDPEAQKALAKKLWDGILALRKVTKFSDPQFMPSPSAIRTMMYYFGPKVGVEREGDFQINAQDDTLPGIGGEPKSDNIKTNPGIIKPKKAA